MLLIFPPVAKPCEPPAGIAKLAGALNGHGVSCTLLDMNLEGMLYLFNQKVPASDTWTRRAVKNLSTNLAALRTPGTYGNFDRYSRAVSDVNRFLEAAGKKHGSFISVADYQDAALSPLRSEDLYAAAGHPERNMFYPYFSKRLRQIIERTSCSSSTAKSKDCPTGSRGSAGLIGFSLNYLSQALCTFSMIGFIRREFPDIKIVLGGGLLSSWMKRPGWKDPFRGLVDHLVPGPGESGLLKLAGIEPHQRLSLPPDYGPLSSGAYLSPGLILPYSASSGCYWSKCSFCPETAEETSYLPVAASQAMEELQALCSKTPPVLVHFLDNAISPVLLQKLAAAAPFEVPWYGFARISKELADMDFCLGLRRSGCTMLKLGLESGDQGILDALHKGIKLETVSQVLRNLEKAGIAAYVYLLFGTPQESAVEAGKTLDFVASHASAISFLNLAVFNMPVCGREAQAYETEAFYEGDLSLYRDFRHPRGWGRKQVRQFLDQEFKRHKAVAAILRRDPPFFTSNHAPFFRKA